MVVGPLGDSSVGLELRWSTPRVSDVQDVDHALVDGEQDSVHVRSAAVEELSNFQGRLPALRSGGTTGRKRAERIDRLAKSREPPSSRIAGLLAYEPGVNRGNV